MKLKIIALAVLTSFSAQLTAQTLKVETGNTHKTGMWLSNSRSYYTDSDGVLTGIYEDGESLHIDALDRISIIKYDDNLNAHITALDGKETVGKTLHCGGIGHFNDKIVLFGFGKDDSKKWDYSIFTIDEKGKLIGSEIKLNYQIKAPNMTTFSNRGFVKSPNNNYGAVYVCHTAEDRHDIFLSAIVFDKDMNVISNLSKRIPNYDKRALIDKVFIDNDGNLIGTLREWMFDDKTSHGVYAFIAKKGATDLTYVKIPTGKKLFQTLDMESTGDDEYRIFGIYKNPTTGHAIIDGASSYAINLDGNVEAGPGIDDPSKFNIFSKLTTEARLITFDYRILPSIKTADGSTIFIVQKVNNLLSSALSHYMDVYMFKYSDKGLEWDIRIPAYTTNFPNFPVLYNKEEDKLTMIYCQKPGHSFTSETAPTPLDDNNSGVANFYALEVDSEGNIKPILEDKQKYPWAFDYFKNGKAIYERVYVGMNEEKIRKVEIE